MKKIMVKTGFAVLAMSLAAFPLDRTLGPEQGLGIPNCLEGTGWHTLFDGTQASLDKYWWLPLTQNHGTGGKWTVANGILYSDQVAGEGGALFTKKKYKNMEIKISVKPNWGNDGGIFLRSNAFGRSYQVVLDYKDGKNLGGIWGESGLHSINYKAFAFSGAGDKITPTANWVDPTKATEWGTKIWKMNDFNNVHARIYKNDPPWIDSWINGFKTILYKDNQVEDQNLTGHIGLQIHKGTGAWRTGFPNEYKSVVVRELDAEANPLPAYPEWTAACPPTSLSNLSRTGPQLGWKLDGDRLRVSGTVDHDFVLTVTDIAGKIVSTAKGGAGFYTHDAGTIRPGIHFVAIRSGSFSQTLKILRTDG